MPDFVAGRRMTLIDCAERGLKKGRGAEQEAAAKLIVLVALQLGNECDSIYKEQKNCLLSLLADNSVSLAARAQVIFCCQHYYLVSFNRNIIFLDLLNTWPLYLYG